MRTTNCRGCFTAEDFQFVVKTLSRSPKDAVSLVDLLSDEETRDEILDHERLYQELIESGACLKVSPAFYFYVLTRHVLKKAGLNDRAVCDYIALILVNFSRWQKLPHFVESAQGEAFYPYLSDMLQAIAKAESHQVFILRIYLANYALFYSGIFVERIVAHRNRRGGPDVSFYEEVGRLNYQLAAEHRSAQSHHLQEILDQLAQVFRPARFALNDLSENLLHLSPNPNLEL
jgi:hypothetical protein